MFDPGFFQQTRHPVDPELHGHFCDSVHQEAIEGAADKPERWLVAPLEHQRGGSASDGSDDEIGLHAWEENGWPGRSPGEWKRGAIAPDASLADMKKHGLGRNPVPGFQTLVKRLAFAVRVCRVHRHLGLEPSEYVFDVVMRRSNIREVSDQHQNGIPRVELAATT